MIDSCCDDSRIEVLQELFTSATHDASAAMCRWTDGLITLTLEEVRETPLEDVCDELELGDEPLTMVVISLHGEVGGEMILTFDDASGRQLAASLLRREPSEGPEWCDLETSALCETGNILGCAYMNALARLINAPLVPSPPTFVWDYGASVLEQALMAQAATCDQVLLFQTEFRKKGQNVNWRVIFIPTEGMRKAVEEGLHSLP